MMLYGYHRFAVCNCCRPLDFRVAFVILNNTANTTHTIIDTNGVRRLFFPLCVLCGVAMIIPQNHDDDDRSGGVVLVYVHTP